MKLRALVLSVLVLVCVVPVNLVVAQSETEASNKLIITELLPNPEGVDTDQEWVEILNLSKDDILMAGYLFKVNDKPAFEFESEAKILAGNYLLVQLSKSPLPNCSSQPCEVKLELLKGNEIVDSTTYGQTIAGKSWSRTVEDKWTLDFEPTPGEENKPKEIIKTLQISEVYPAPNSGETEWLELINYGDKEIDLGDWYITDKTGKHKLEGTILPKAFLILEDLAISLNNSDEVISLFAPDGTKVDEFVYAVSSKGMSLIRLGNKVVVTQTVTPGSENIFASLLAEAENPVTEKPQIDIVPKVKGVAEVAMLPNINYLMPREGIDYLPSFVSSKPIEVSTKGLAIYCLAMAILILWRQGSIQRYYDWWVSG